MNAVVVRAMRRVPVSAIAVGTITVRTITVPAITVRTMRPWGTMTVPRLMRPGVVAVAGLVADHRLGCRLPWQILVGRRHQHRDALLGQPLDALELAALGAVAERDGDARGAGARR